MELFAVRQALESCLPIDFFLGGEIASDCQDGVRLLKNYSAYLGVDYHILEDVKLLYDSPCNF